MTSADHRPEPDTAPEPEAFPALEDPYRRSLLTNEQRNAWAALSAASLGLVSQMESDLHRDAGLTPFEFHLLYVLGAEEASREAEGTMPMSRAAQLVDSSLSRLSHVVRRIEKRGWVERRPSAEDARVTLVGLTPEGRRRMEAAVPAYDRMVCRVFVDHMAEEDLAEVTRLSMRLLAGLREGHWLFDAMDPDGSRRAGVAGADAGAVTGATGESEADSEGRPAS